MNTHKAREPLLIRLFIGFIYGTVALLAISTFYLAAAWYNLGVFSGSAFQLLMLGNACILGSTLLMLPYLIYQDTKERRREP